MTDQQIIDLYLNRSEQAISETASCYGQLLFRISHNILNNREDAEECVSDTYLTVWDQIPPDRPKQFSSYLGKITRCLSIDKWRHQQAGKRGGGQLTLAVEELNHVLPSDSNVEDTLLRNELTATLNAFLKSLPRDERNIFLRRYWYMDSIRSIADTLGFSQSKVKTTLSRTRKKLKHYLITEGGFSNDRH